MSAACSIAASASSRRPSAARRPERLAATRPGRGRNASGRASASWRWMSDGLLDRGQRLLPPPQLCQAAGKVVQRPGQVGAERVGPRVGELAVDVCGLLDRGQRLLPPPQVAQTIGQVVQRQGEVGQERVGPRVGELAVDVCGLLDRGQGLLPPPQGCQADRQVVQRPRRGRGGTRRAARRRAGGRCLRPARSRPGPPPAAPGPPGDRTGCSATWPGRGGTRRAGRAASWR